MLSTISPPSLIGTPEKRPQDPNLNGDGLRFETSEQGGDYPDTMPLAIRLIDAQGRSCVYVSDSNRWMSSMVGSGY